MLDRDVAANVVTIEKREKEEERQRMMDLTLNGSPHIPHRLLQECNMTEYEPCIFLAAFRGCRFCQRRRAFRIRVLLPPPLPLPLPRPLSPRLSSPLKLPLPLFSRMLPLPFQPKLPT